MKKYIIVLCLLLVSKSTVFAQEQKGVATVIGTAASQKENLNLTLTQSVSGVNKTFTIQKVSLQVGMPYMGMTDKPFSNNSTQYYKQDLGFPWGIRYRYNTFSEDAFTVSKGYFSDRIEINWDVKSNREKIISISVYRTEDIDSQNPNWGKSLKTLAADAGTYVDTNIEGGKLYRYKIAAKGVEVDGLEILYSTYITGVGYRNPTGVITGNVSFTGGNPVKDVMVVANPTGKSVLFGSSLKIPAAGYISVPRLNKSLKDSMTLQVWAKPVNDWNSSLTLYNVESDANESLNFHANYDTGRGYIQLVIGGAYVAVFGHYPSGEIDNNGDDIFLPINAITNSFTHFSAVIRDNKAVEFYINGRLINEAYRAKMTNILAQTGLPPARIDITNSPVKLNTSTKGQPQAWTHFKMGGGNAAYLDEFRVWETALAADQIQRDFRRYLSGGENGLNTYLTANEKIGDYAYDLAHNGFNYHGNDAKLSNPLLSTTNTPTFDNSGTNIPTSTQLGVLGITDEFGNYVISAVPYKGNGDSFTIVPSLGKHEFNPSQQLAYIGIGSTVINKVDFIDKSSFIFKGIAVYDSRGVFPKTSDAPITGDIKDNEAYNAYIKGNQKYQKGEYWADKDALGNTILKRYAPIPVPGANVFIDNVQAIDAFNIPIQTDIKGQFTVEVPIGQHAISISKSGHTFDFEGRYPARNISVVNGITTTTNTYQEFFEDRDEPTTFIDNTKVTVVGRVVGGTVQADKEIGFGADGKKTYAFKDANGVSRTTVYTSENNIGTANLTFGYLPTGATSVTPEYKTSFKTNAETGEYRVALLPLNYILSKNDLTFTSGKNPDNIPILDADRTINFSAMNGLKYPTFVQGTDTITGKPYQEVLKFTHVAAPIHQLLSQTSDQTMVSNGITYTIAPTQNTPIYTQFLNYKIEVQGQEIYKNYDKSLTNPVVSKVPVEGGELVPTNNLALAESEKIEVSTKDPSILIYSFQGGTPNTDIGTGFKRTIDLKFRTNGIDYPVLNYKTDGILLGGVSDGSQTFVTAGPEIPDIILRDPPGSGSSATIEKGSSFSFTKETTTTGTSGTDFSSTISAGTTLTLSGGLVPLPETTIEATADATKGMTSTSSTSDGKSVSTTYSFSQTISTSDDPDWIGSDADIYIGTSANQFYGTYNDLVVTTERNTVPIAVTYMNGAVKTAANIYPKVNKAMYFSDSPEKTTFVYTQRNILTELIPNYLDIIAQINAGTLKENQNGVFTKSAYNSSINLWRKIILNNELQKYQAFKNKDQLRASLNSIIESLKDPVTKKLSPSDKALQDLLNKTFFENISFDAGIGEITKGLGIGRLSSTSYAYEVQVDKAFIIASGLTVNDAGFAMESTTSTGSGSGSANTDDNEETTTITYTLKDNDANNLLSVDVINAFDGNGPIFITKGGQTSCPYEGPELSYFYNPTHPNVTNPSATIVDLPTVSQVQLSLPTVAIEKPEITVNVVNVVGIFDGRNAEFVLQLRNTSTVNKDATFKLYIDQTTNPDNAAINIEPNGTFITIPKGETVTYTMTLKKVKQDQFDYKNIKVSLESSCDGDATSSVLVSATFVPACSPVAIMAPSNNWLLNKNTATDDGATTKPVNIKLGDYNTSFASFQKINLEYRLTGTPNWIGLRTYYKTQQDFNMAFTGGDTNIELITGNELNYAWDIAGLGLANGSYELQARTSCNNQTAFVSAIIEGKVDLTAPVLFGTPTPKNGILGLGDDITLQFNEPVKTNGTVTKFEFLVQKNQSPVKHEVSLAFNGASNTATINKPAINTGDFSIEFWLKNTSPSGSSVLLNQNNGIKIELIDSDLKYSIGGQSISVSITKDNTFNHYALSYSASANTLRIIENDIEKKVQQLTAKLNFTNENSIVLGGNTFKGNLHDLRFWKRSITREAAVSNMNSILNGNETDLLGYWPINEGNGLIANDLARYKHLAITNTNWDINPKGAAYKFDGTNYLSIAEASKVIISKEMDATLSFWMKTNQTGAATLLSNGKGDASDAIESNGYRNKWAISLTDAGTIELQAEAKKFPFGSNKVNNNSWHHVALSLTRNGSIRMYIDGNQVESYASNDLGGFTSSTIFVGARGIISPLSIDQNYVGLMDELCIWGAARDAEQIKSDQYHELDFNSIGLLLYTTFNKPETANAFGPQYYYPLNTSKKTSSYALLNNKPLAFTDETPAIKPFRPTESIVVDAVINGDKIVLNPQITDWSTIEGKVAYITVSNLNDMADNRQLSPVTWSALINKNPVKWFVEGHSDIVSMIKRANENLAFDITIINNGGTSQNYTIDLPSWLTLTSNSGTIAPNTKLTLRATVNSGLAIGNYNSIISLATNYNYNEKIQLDLRVLEKEPAFDLDPSKFSQSMNIIGRIKLGDVFTDDLYDRLIATVNGVVRGVAYVNYDATLKDYFVYLTVYSNQISGENLTFAIWDASDGKLKQAIINDNLTIPYLADQIIGNYTNPAIFKNTEVTGQQILLNQGWTWTSFNVTDGNFNNLNELTKSLTLGTSDLIMSNAPALFDAYQVSATNPTASGWSGTVSSNGGIFTNKMYKIKVGSAQKLNIKGVPVNLNTWFIDLARNWNWFPFVVSKNVPIADALANLTASDGDVIKSQSAFAIYSPAVGWKGTLSFLKAGEGYMLSTAIAQKFTYPEYLNRTSKKISSPKAAQLSDTQNDLLSYQYAQFPNTMSAVVQLPKGFESLAFYNETGQLRGNTITQNIDGTDLAFITIYGNQPETLTAYIGKGKSKQATTKSIPFFTDAILGSIADPVLIDLLEEKISIYPNPFYHDLEIAIETKERGDVKVLIYNMLSQVVFEDTFKIDADAAVLKIGPALPSGVYLLQIQIKGKVITEKIIKN